MNETKFEPFIKGSMAVLTLCALVCMAVFIPRGSEALGKATQPTPIVSELCESSALPEATAAAERVVLTPPRLFQRHQLKTQILMQTWWLLMPKKSCWPAWSITKLVGSLLKGRSLSFRLRSIAICTKHLKEVFLTFCWHLINFL